MANSNQAGFVYRQNAGAQGGPIYQLRREDIIDMPSDVIVIATNRRMEIDKDEIGKRRKNWHRKAAGNAAGLQWRRGGLPPVRTTNHVLYTVGMAPPLYTTFNYGDARETASHNLPSRWTIMVRLRENLHPNGNADAELREAVVNALDQAYAAPLAGAIPDGQNWYVAVSSIAFPLLGSGASLKYGTDNSADIILDAITRWFNDPADGANRQAYFNGGGGQPGVYLLVPHTYSDTDRRTHRDIQRAWERAWDNHIGAGAPPPRALTQRRINKINRELAEANDILNRGIGAARHRVTLPDNLATMQALSTPGVALPAGAPPPGNRVAVRATYRVLRPRQGANGTSRSRQRT